MDSIDFERKKVTLNRNWMQEDIEIDFQYYDAFNELAFTKVCGMSDFWKSNNKIDFNQIFSDILSGLSGENVEFSYVIISNKESINIYIGVSKDLSESLKDVLAASYPFIKTETPHIKNVENTLEKIGKYGGIILGNPTDKIKEDQEINQIEKLIMGLYGQKWAYIVAAKGINTQEASDLLEETLLEMNEVSPQIKRSLGKQGHAQEESIEVTNYTAQSYLDDLTIFSEKLQNGHNNGMWRSMSYYMAENEMVSKKMGRLLKSVFAGSESIPQSVRNFSFSNEGIMKLPRYGIGLINDKLDEEYLNFLAIKAKNSEPYSFYSYKYQNIISSNDLAVYCQIPKEEAPGYYIDSYVKFDVSERRSEIDYYVGDVVYNGNVLKNNAYKIDLKSLNRHTLITGITGGGKTNTSKHLLTSLFSQHKKPFLVIESAKREYWELGRFSELNNFMVFTLGNEGKKSVKYRLNPFERIGETSIQTHIDYILSAFKASFELYAPMPYVLETCVYEIYSDLGWDILEDTNVYGKNDYPTLEALYYKVEIVVDRLGYDNKLRSDIIAALQARISSLLIGGKGAMLNTQKSFPMEKLLNSPVVLELEDIGDDDTKSFIIGIILIQLYEHRKSATATGNDLKHILLIEEAHRLLMNVSTQQSSDSANPRGKAVEFFCNLLAEIRSYGQGIMISDQMPTKLAPDVLKNTNLKITHRIVTKEDRDVIGNAMNMSEEQINYISTFKTGFAAVYSEGDSRPKLVKMPFIKCNSSKSREDILLDANTRIKSLAPEIYKTYNSGLACSFCNSKCKFKKRTLGFIDDEIVNEKFIAGVAEYIDKSRVFNEATIKSIITNIERSKLNRCLLRDEKLCMINHFLEKINVVTNAYKREAIIRYLKIM